MRLSVLLFEIYVQSWSLKVLARQTTMEQMF